jgi:FlaA1/EpsC-like NDP-sugar epimerase
MPVRSKILIIGAGEAGRMLLAEYVRRGHGSSIAGFADDDPEKTGRLVDDKPVLGNIADLEKIITAASIDEAVIAIPSADPALISGIVSRIMSIRPRIGLHLLPEAERFFDTTPLIPALKGFSFSDLFEREEYTLDLDLMKKSFGGSTVMVTGAGGSIGSELCRQLLRFEVKNIIAVGRGENSIYELASALEDYAEQMTAPPMLHYRIADVKDRGMLSRIFRELKPDTVFHAAAHKHVPLMEFNEAEALRNNAGGTWNLLDCCREHGTGRFVMVSTDKAVRPANVMGATKRIAEQMVQGFYSDKGLNTTVVRFGNVIGSRGSVIPLFQKQIEAGGPVTVTHPEIERFFMSIPEAALLVLNAASYAKGGEVFVLDMGRQYRVIDVARRLIGLYGLVPDRDIKLKITGLRPGEKLSEELFYETGSLRRTSNNRIMVCGIEGERLPFNELEKFVEQTLPVLHEMTSDEVRKTIMKLVPGFTSSNTGAVSCERIVK